VGTVCPWMLILISSCLLVASRDFLLAHSFIGSVATSGAESSGIGVNGSGPLRARYLNRKTPILKQKTNVLFEFRRTHYENAQYFSLAYTSYGKLTNTTYAMKTAIRRRIFKRGIRSNNKLRKESRSAIRRSRNKGNS